MRRLLLCACGLLFATSLLRGQVTIATQPVSQSVAPGTIVALTVGATGSGTLSYQWRKNGSPINPIVYPSATTASLVLGAASVGDSGSYDVLVTDSIGTIASSAATLLVGITPATVTLGGLSITFDGSPHPASVTTTPANLSVNVTYNGGSTVPTNVGGYSVVATITDPAYSGSATGTLVIAAPTPAAQTVTFVTPGSFAPLVGVPFTVSATASSGLTPVVFTLSPSNTGSATVSGTNGSTITINTTAPVTIRATQAGNLFFTSASADLILTATAPSAISNPYTQTFDSLATGLPTGWHVFTGASSTSLGTDVGGASFVSSVSTWSDTTGNFRNVASALNSGATSGSTTGAQNGFTNRALGVRQTGSFGDPGATFAFNCITTGVNLLSISFSAQLLSVQTNSTTWLLQSGVGANPTSWSTLATFTDPGVFGATLFTVSNLTFGNALNNQANIWLRVVALNATTGSGTRDTFAIDNFSIVTAPAVAVTSQPVAQSVTSGQSASFSVIAIGTGPISYQWRKAGTAIGGATSSTFTIPSALTTDAGSYSVTVTDSVGSITSTAVALTVAPITTTIALSNLTASYDGSPHAATATPTPGAATLSLTYFGIAGTPYAATSTPPTNPGSYLVMATASDAEHQGSASAILVISGASGATAPVVVTAPQSKSALVGDVVSFSVDATGSPLPTLQWRKDGVAITGATNNTYTLVGVALTDAGNYDVAIANSGGSITSPSAALTVAKKDQTITFAAPTNSLAAGAAIRLTATASSGLPVSYTIVSGAGSISGSTLTGLGASVVVRASQAGNSSTFNAAPNIDRTFTFVSGGSAPFLFSSPVDQTVNGGATVTFSAAAVGTPTPTWQWQKDGVDIAGATNAALTLTIVSLADAARYTVIATNSVGTASATATLAVRAAPVFTLSPADQSVAAGTNVTFTSAVTGFPTPTLQWRKNGVAISGAVSNTLTLVSVRASEAARYDLVATNSLGSATSATATLAIATRDFSGTYFGKFSGATGDFALYVRTDGTGIFLGFLPGLKTGLFIPNVAVDLAGNFSLPFSTLGSSAASGLVALTSPGTETTPPSTAAAAQSATLRGSVDEVNGSLTASIAELALSLTGTKTVASGAANAQAGFYSGALVGSAAGRGYVMVAPDGQALALAANGTSIDGAKGTIGSNGRLAVTTSDQTALDLGFANGALAGTVRTATGVVGTLSGASDALAGSERLANLSARGGLAPGAPLIAGFVITGSSPKQVLIRAAGPAIAAAPFNVAGTIDDPALSVFRGNTVIAQNDNWSTPAANVATITAAAAQVNAFAFRAGSADAALLTTLAPGNYTVQVAGGAASRDGTGVALVEIYEVIAPAEAAGSRRLANLSARGPVAPGAPLIAGFVINGTAPQRVLLRGVGPALGAFNVPGTLANPILTLFRGSTALKTNDDWFRDADAALIRDAAAKSGAFALGANSTDSSMVLYLEPGAYTAQVSSTGNAGGTALVEVYEVGP